MTLPIMIQNHNKKVTHTKLQKAYSILSQAFSQVVYYNDIGNYNFFLSSVNEKGVDVYSVFYPYIKHLDICGTSNNMRNCYPDMSNVYRYKNRNSYIYLGWFDDGQFVTKDGMFFMFQNEIGIEPIFIQVDVNGFHKGPNQIGRDLFTFEITNDLKVVPVGENTLGYSLYCKNYESAGIACETDKVLYDTD